MFGTLLESRARRRRRPGGAAVSIAVHMVIIGAITAGTVHGTAVSKEKPALVLLRFENPPPPAPPPRPIDHTIRDVVLGPVNAAPIQIHRIDAPLTILDHLPPIDSSFGRGLDSIVIGQRQLESGTGARHRRRCGAERVERMGRGRSADSNPRVGESRDIPESLRQAAIDGRVLVRFAVDTSGRIDMSSVTVLASTHDLFTRAVRDALPVFRFKPAELGGHRVRALAEMPFEFQITK